MRTFSRSEWDAAQRAWAEGEFSDEWRDVRHQAAMRGMAYPPSGTRWDSWDAGSPSQRAIIVRAIRDHPRLLAECVGASWSWSQVVARLMSRLAAWREEVAERDADDRRRRDADRHLDRAAMRSVADVLATLADSGRPLR